MPRPQRNEQSMINHEIRYASNSGYSGSGLAYKDAVTGACDHITGLGADPHGTLRYTFASFAEAQSEASRVKTWALANL